MLPNSLHLQDLKDYCTLSPVRCAAFAEAASICLESQSHLPGISAAISGNFSTEFSIFWNSLEANVKSSYLLEETIEDGAYGLAILIIRQVTPFKVIKQSFRGSGFDYWLGEHDDFPPFQEKARLEVSGILKGTKGQINQRLKEKLNQTKKSDNFNLPAFVIIVEFSQPQIKIKER